MTTLIGFCCDIHTEVFSFNCHCCWVLQEANGYFLHVMYVCMVYVGEFRILVQVKTQTFHLSYFRLRLATRTLTESLKLSCDLRDVMFFPKLYYCGDTLEWMSYIMAGYIVGWWWVVVHYVCTQSFCTDKPGWLGSRPLAKLTLFASTTVNKQYPGIGMIHNNGVIVVIRAVPYR